MTATLCPWTADCLPDDPFIVAINVVMILAVIALAINDYIGDD